jgi:hypothetical protein
LSSDFLWVQGTDTTGILSCNLNVGRYATEAFGGGYTAAEWEVDSCAIDGGSNYSVNAILQTAANDTTHYRDGSPLTPNQPNPLVWWDETGVPGMNADATVQDQAVWFTYKHDYNLGASDTLNYWTVLTTTTGQNNAAVSLTDLEGQVATARKWYMEVVRGCETGCCVGRVGDANFSGDDEPTIGDISVMIDAKFITGNCVGPDSENPILPCLLEADINQSGSTAPTCDDVTIGDISYLIDYLFITGPSLGLNPCL